MSDSTQRQADASTLEDVVDTLQMASREGRRVRPTGGRSWVDAWGLDGPLPARPDITLGMSGFDHVDAYEPADLTMTVGAGITLDRIVELTAPNGQWLAVDPRHAPSATLGATVATASGGPLRTGYGSMRDHVLGMTMVTGDGRVLELGGRVVKNVAGFDLLKLMVGGWGRFGVITQITVRLHPLPARDVTLVWASDDVGRLASVGRALATAPVVPAALQLDCSDSMPCLMARVVGSEASAPVEVDMLAQAAGETGLSVAQKEGAASVDIWARQQGLTPHPTELEVSFKPSELPAMVESISAAHAQGWRVRCDVTEGVCAVEGSSDQLDSIVDWSHAASVRALRAGPEERARLASTRETTVPAVRQLVERLLKAFDPSGVLG